MMRKLLILFVTAVFSIASFSASAGESAFLSSISPLISIKECSSERSGGMLVLRNCLVETEAFGSGKAAEIIVENETANKIGRLSIHHLRLENLQARDIAWEGLSGDFSILPIVTPMIAKAVKKSKAGKKGGDEEAELFLTLRYAISELSGFKADKCGAQDILIKKDDSDALIKRASVSGIGVFSCGPGLIEDISFAHNAVPYLSIASVGWQGYDLTGLKSVLNMDLRSIAKRNALSQEQISEILDCNISDLVLDNIKIPLFSGSIGSIGLNLKGAGSVLKGALKISDINFAGKILEEFGITEYPPDILASIDSEFEDYISPDGVQTSQRIEINGRDLLEADADFRAFFNADSANLEKLDLRLADKGIINFITTEQKVTLTSLAAMLSPQIASDVRKFLTSPGRALILEAAHFPADPDFKITLEQEALQ